MPAMTANPGFWNGAAAITHVGRVRTRNEDAVAIGSGGRVLVCADGLGGLPHGDVASRTAVEHLVATLEREVAENPAGKRWSRLLRRALLGAHEAVESAGRRQTEPVEIGTTVVVALLTARRAYVGHVGDVRCYLASRRGFRRVTDDHSSVFEAVLAGRMTVEQARRHPERNIVTQALGLGADLAPGVVSLGISRGDTLLLCSDGLWETMPEDELAALVDVDTGTEEIAARLVERALAHGGPDNISVIVYRHGGDARALVPDRAPR
jgi:serine/threonine protein phosphatase PrpC